MKKQEMPNPFPRHDVDPADVENIPSDAEEFALANGLGPDDTIMSVFTPQEKERLLKAMKHGEFNPRESAVLKALMSAGEAEGNAFNLDELGVFIGAASPRTKGQPTSKVAALKELNRILAVLAKRSYIKFGKKIDVDALKNFQKVRNEMLRANKAKAAERKRRIRAEQKRRAEAQKEFWKNLSELNRLQRSMGLEPTRYDKIMRTWTTAQPSTDHYSDR